MEENTADIPVDNEEPVATIIEEQPKSILKPRKRTEKQREAFKKCQEGRARACAERKQNPVSRKKKVNIVPQVVYLPPQAPESESESESEAEQIVYVQKPKKKKKKKKQKKTRVVYVSDDSDSDDSYEEQKYYQDSYQQPREVQADPETIYDSYRFI